MARDRTPRHKQSRREGVNLTGKDSLSLERRLGVPPGGARRGRRSSEYGLRLRAKQRVKGEYGVLERQFRRLFEEARRRPGSAGGNLLAMLERRLDNVVYRLGVATTRPMARQLVTHGHVSVDGETVTIPSFEVQPGARITLQPQIEQMPEVQRALSRGPVLPSWLERDGLSGRIIGEPRREEIAPDIREDLIVEFYSR